MSDEPASAMAPLADTPLRARFGALWWAAVIVSGALAALLGAAMLATLFLGLGIWGLNAPFVWGLDLVNYAWWVGIANGSSLFAAILVLRRHDLRTAVNRFAESVALFSVFVAGLFPIIHLGRPWLFWWVYPYPATYEVWPQFRSVLTWDFWAISTHVIVTSLLWYVGLIPDLATMRDRAPRLWKARLYGVLALGWRSSVRHWSYQQSAYRLVAVLILPLILMMQSVVALEFSTMLVPGWHGNRLPIHFVATGLVQGMAAVLLIGILLRWGLRLEHHIDDADIDLLARLVLASALASGFLLAVEIVTARLEGEAAWDAVANRLTGATAFAYWMAATLGVLVPQLLWFKRLRGHLAIAALAAFSAGLGVWFDRYSLMIGGLEVDHLTATSGAYAPSATELALFAGTLGLFALLLLLFARTLPVVSMAETRHAEEEA